MALSYYLHNSKRQFWAITNIITNIVIISFMKYIKHIKYMHITQNSTWNVMYIYMYVSQIFFIHAHWICSHGVLACVFVSAWREFVCGVWVSEECVWLWGQMGRPEDDVRCLPSLLFHLPCETLNLELNGWQASVPP